MEEKKKKKRKRKEKKKKEKENLSYPQAVRKSIAFIASIFSAERDEEIHSSPLPQLCGYSDEYCTFIYLPFIICSTVAL